MALTTLMLHPTTQLFLCKRAWVFWRLFQVLHSCQDVWVRTKPGRPQPAGAAP